MTRHQIDEHILYECDCCGKALWLLPEEPLVEPWRAFSLRGWVGDFFCCSEACEKEFRDGR